MLNNQRVWDKTRAAFGIVLLLLFSYLMFGIIFPYTSGRLDIDFLLTKQHIIHLLHYRWAFYFHIFSSLLILLSGLTQFSSYVLRQWPQVHRWVGKAYVVLILFISGPAALIMSFYGNGGWPARISFVLLSLLWWGFTFHAWRLALQRQFQAHAHFMIRSFALTLSAISLRLYQLLINSYFDVDPEVLYIFLSWFSWLGNLAVAEWVIYKRSRVMTGPPPT